MLAHRSQSVTRLPSPVPAEPPRINFRERFLALARCTHECVRSATLFHPVRLERPPQLRAQPLGQFSVHLALAAAAQPFARRLRQPLNCVDQGRARMHQSRSRSDDRQIRLGFSTAVCHWPQQFLADSCQPARGRASNDHLCGGSLHSGARCAPGTRSLHGLAHSIGWTASRPKISSIAFGVAACFCSSSASAASSRTHYQLDRSPRSRPMVSLLQNKTGPRVLTVSGKADCRKHCCRASRDSSCDIILPFASRLHWLRH